jgi:hypothetical protein
MLCAEPESFAQKKIGLVLCCSPSWGSNYAWFLRPLTWLIGNKQAVQLSTDHDALKDLDRDWQAILDKGLLDLKGTCLLETRLRILGLIRVPILVPEASAARYFPWRRIARVDHSQLVKPDSVQNASHQAVRDFAHSKGFLTRGEFCKALRELLQKMNILAQAYLPDRLETVEGKARSIEGVRLQTLEAMKWRDRDGDGLQGLLRLRGAALDASGEWAFRDFSRTEFAALREELEHEVGTYCAS